MSNIEPKIEKSFNLVDPENYLLPADTAVDARFINDDAEIAVDKVRFVGFEADGEKDASIVMLDEYDQVIRVPLGDVPGLTYLGNDESMYPVVAFNYFKQEVGAESTARIIRLTGVAYGVHAGHLGVPEKDIPAEKPGWYMVAEQVGTSASDGDIEWQEPADRVFPFARIVDGPLGDPQTENVQAQFGLY